MVGSSTVPSPLRLISDGKNIWTVSNSGLVSKIQAKDGLLVGSYRVGGPTSGITFDGENVWVTHGENDKVTKLRASDGSIVGSYPAGKAPDGILFDGQFIWVANSGSNTLMKINPANGASVGTFTLAGHASP